MLPADITEVTVPTVRTLFPKAHETGSAGEQFLLSFPGKSIELTFSIAHPDKDDPGFIVEMGGAAYHGRAFNDYRRVFNVLANPTALEKRTNTLVFIEIQQVKKWLDIAVGDVVIKPPAEQPAAEEPDPQSQAA